MDPSPPNPSIADAEGAVVQLEKWFLGLTPEHRAVIGPVLIEGILAEIEGVDEEVQGHGQFTAGPPLLQALRPQHAPTITWLIGMSDWEGNAQPQRDLMAMKRR